MTEPELWLRCPHGESDEKDRRYIKEEKEQNLRWLSICVSK
jgi:hypothetical protein